jgi:hypothetical protein
MSAVHRFSLKKQLTKNVNLCLYDNHKLFYNYTINTMILTTDVYIQIF